MAEQSLGWSTNGVGDGVNGGYNTARMTAMENKTFSDGVFLGGGNFVATNNTTTFTIADGSALVNGYFYENTSPVTFTPAWSTGVRYVCVIANYGTSPITVTQCIAANNPSGTTIAPYTVRLGVVETLTAPANVKYIPLWEMTREITGITAMLDIRLWANSPAQAYGVLNPISPFTNTGFAYMTKSTTQAIANNTTTLITAWSANQGSGDGIWTPNMTSGQIEFNGNRAAIMFDALVNWDNNTTGSRQLEIWTSLTGQTWAYGMNQYHSTGMLATNVSILGPASTTAQRFSGIIMLYRPVITVAFTNPAGIGLAVRQNSGASRNIVSAQLAVARIG